MIIIETFIKTKDSFVNIEKFDAKVTDPMYVEGAIYIKIDETEILTLDLWDDVNWLWGFIVTGIEDLQNQTHWETGFPDQPINLSFSLDKRQNSIEITVEIPQKESSNVIRKTKTNLTEFLTELNKAGQKYFNLIIEIGGEDGKRESERLNKAIDKILQ